jgi:tripartite-type tricarboxylate transporter receptor subunit TctC
LLITSLERSNLLPDYRTVNESGLPGFEVIVWYGIFAPSGTPESTIQRLNNELRLIVDMPDVKRRLSEEGAEPLNGYSKRICSKSSA